MLYGSAHPRMPFPDSSCHSTVDAETRNWRGVNGQGVVGRTWRSVIALPFRASLEFM